MLLGQHKISDTCLQGKSYKLISMCKCGVVKDPYLSDDCSFGDVGGGDFAANSSCLFLSSSSCLLFSSFSSNWNIKTTDEIILPHVQLYASDTTIKGLDNLHGSEEM